VQPYYTRAYAVLLKMPDFVIKTSVDIFSTGSPATSQRTNPGLKVPDIPSVLLCSAKI